MDARRINGIFFVDCLARPLKAGRAGQLILDATDCSPDRSAERVLGVDIAGEEVQVHAANAIHGTGPVVADRTNVADAAVTVVPVAPRRIDESVIRYTKRIRFLIPIRFRYPTPKCSRRNVVSHRARIINRTGRSIPKSIILRTTASGKIPVRRRLNENSRILTGIVEIVS